MPQSDKLREFTKTAPDRYMSLYTEKDPEKKREKRQALQRDENSLFRGFGMNWYYYAREEANSPREKFVMFLQDVFVVEQRKIKIPSMLYSMQQTLREGASLN